MTTKAKKRTAKYKIISLRKLSKESKIDYAKIYNNLSGRYESLTVNEQTRLSNSLCEEVTEFFKIMGFKLKLERIPMDERFK